MAEREFLQLGASVARCQLRVEKRSGWVLGVKAERGLVLDVIKDENVTEQRWSCAPNQLSLQAAAVRGTGRQPYRVGFVPKNGMSCHLVPPDISARQ